MKTRTQRPDGTMIYITKEAKRLKTALDTFTEFLPIFAKAQRVKKRNSFDCFYGVTVGLYTDEKTKEIAEGIIKELSGAGYYIHDVSLYNGGDHYRQAFKFWGDYKRNGMVSHESVDMVITENSISIETSV